MIFLDFFYFSRPIDRKRQVRVYVAIVGNFRIHNNNSDPYLTKISTLISGNILLEQYQYLAIYCSSNININIDFLKNCNININIENPIDLYPWHQIIQALRHCATLLAEILISLSKIFKNLEIRLEMKIKHLICKKLLKKF